jgi:hypothetical protein
MKYKKIYNTVAKTDKVSQSIPENHMVLGILKRT